MKKVFIVIFFICSSLLAQSKSLTIEESIKIGIENNDALRYSASKLKESEEKTKEISSMLLPQISLGASYARLSDVPPFEVNIPIFPTPIKLQDVILNNYSLKASLLQPLFTGFRLSSLKNASELNNKSVQEEHNKELNNAAFEIKSAYWNFALAQIMLELADKSVERAASHLNDTKNFFSNELVTKSDYLKIEVLYSNSKLRQIEAHNAMNIARAVFNKSIGYDLSALTNINIAEPEINFGTIDFESLLEEGINNRSELKSVAYMVEASKENITAANSGWYPSLSLFGNYYYNNPNQRIMPIKEKFYDTWDMGVSLNWNIWDWGQTSAKAAQAEEKKIQAETALKMTKDNIHLEIYSSYLNLKKEYDKVQLNKISFEQAKENLKIVRDQYQVQLATSTDLIDAETSYLDAETKFVSSKIDFEIARLRLEKAVGKRIY